MRRWMAAVLSACCLAAGIPAAGGAQVETGARAAIVMDGDSGRVLYEKNARQALPIASTTKLMTALVALESGCQPEERVTVDPAWVGAEGSSIYLRAGEELSLNTLLHGLLLRSGNDAALAVAGHCGGTVEAFVAQMNEKARQLGMEDSTFADPSGLSEHSRASARDMALLARVCLENQILAGIAATRSATLEGRNFTNHNKLLWRYEGCIGLKTGYTQRAGRTLVSAARRDGLTLICVTLDDPDDWADHARLLDWGFARYRAATPLREGEEVGRIPVEGSLLPVCPVVAGEDLTLALQEGEQVVLSPRLKAAVLTAPVEPGSQVGEMVCTLEGEQLARIPLLAGGGAERNAVRPGGLLEKWMAYLMGEE